MAGGPRPPADLRRVHIGTCSWNYDSWVGSVYSRPRQRAVEYLGEYAEHFDTAEIDSWFYTIPDRNSVAEYAAAVPDTFRWTCKAPRQLCTPHLSGRRGQPARSNADFLSVDLFTRFVDVIEPIMPALDAVMLEFEYLNRQKMPGGLAGFIERLSTFLDRARSAVGTAVPIAIEPRNAQFIAPEWFEFLASRGVAHVLSQKQYMPDVGEVYATHSARLKRLPLLILRLLGGDRREIEELTGGSWDRIVIPRDHEKEVIAGVIADYVKEGYATVNVNNHYEGSAPITIQTLRRLARELASPADATDRNSPVDRRTTPRSLG